MLSEGYGRRGLGLARVVELASTNPARAFGLYPRKGAIAVGSDADLAVVDPNRERVITPEVLCSAQDPSQGQAVVTALAGALDGGQLDSSVFNAAVQRVTVLRNGLQ